jgi:RNA polymerase sigma-70 factor (ECF subfamily)
MSDLQPRDATEAFVQLVISHQPRLRAFVRSLVPDRAAAADVLQETNLVLWRKAGEFTLGSDFPAWMFRIARYQVMAYRKRLGRDRLAFDDELVARIADEAERRSELAESKRDALVGCLGKLPDDQRRMIDDRYTESRTPAQIAERTGRPVASIRQTLYRIRLALAECIERALGEGGAP